MGVIVSLVTLGSGHAEAGLLSLEAIGAFGPTSTLGATAFGADTPYSFGAVFDSTKDRTPMSGDGAGYFRATQFTITIDGYGTFEGIPNDDLNVALLDPTYHLGLNAAGLLTSHGEPFFLDAYSAVAPPFDPHAPTPVTFLGYLGTLSGFPYVVSLAGGTGELVINERRRHPADSIPRRRSRGLVASLGGTGRAGPLRSAPAQSTCPATPDGAAAGLTRKLPRAGPHDRLSTD